MENVRRIESNEKIEKYSTDSVVTFYMKNAGTIDYIIDRFTVKDVKKRLKSLKGVLKIGSDNKNRIDLNQVAKVKIDNEVIEA